MNDVVDRSKRGKLRKANLEGAPNVCARANMASKFLKWLVWLVALGSAFFAVSYGQEPRNSGVGLSGSTRSEFVKSVVDSCLPKQINDPSNKGIPASLLVEYCDCYASDMADRLSNNDLKSVEGLEKEKIVAKFQTAITAAAAVCLDKAKRKLPQSN